MNKTFTVFRATKSFFYDINSSQQKLSIHRSRTFSFFGGKKDLDAAIDAINKMFEHKWLVPAATVSCECLNKMFELTNTINRAWTENPEVTVIPDTDAFMSSSSVGDFCTDETGNAYIIASYGFELISKDSNGKYKLSEPSR